jgi:phosphatidylserine/phosphatidylglycerophosphate/cardiolipin synthase-like enzyme
VAVWRVDDLTVHSKLVLIDDRFAMLGSANFRARSMRGVDTELQLALVAGDDTVRRLRATLWAEHLGLEPIERPLIDDLDRALGHWHPAWPTGAPLPATRRRLITRVME